MSKRDHRLKRGLVVNIQRAILRHSIPYPVIVALVTEEFRCNREQKSEGVIIRRVANVGV